MRIVLEHLCPHLHGRIVEIGDSVRLRAATGKNLTARVGTLARKAKARAARDNAEIACVFVHEDLDRPDGPEYGRAHARVEKALLDAFDSAHYVLSVSEMEAWLLLFPEALSSFASTWAVPPRYHRTDTGALADPKRILMRECATGRRCYRESDAPEILAHAVKIGHLDRPVGTNRSWNQLRVDAAACCRHHLGRAGAMRRTQGR